MVNGRNWKPSFPVKTPIEHFVLGPEKSGLPIPKAAPQLYQRRGPSERTRRTTVRQLSSLVPLCFERFQPRF